MRSISGWLQRGSVVQQDRDLPNRPSIRKVGALTEGEPTPDGDACELLGADVLLHTILLVRREVREEVLAGLLRCLAWVHRGVPHDSRARPHNACALQQV
eukprot:CAMPEP_0195124564 /NCGR_PEP_ID=MMETSP0448-20130528/131102_1 /TAXON_ID=66468 /ORGANISM="Heterocapsa triquestra, Strain CCMP 448" /LENGTH=99 /DNA_ID=CAMNT_0040162165 /DNA_START=138 /DNA_END=438 /DNA_ORIENTATION=+